MKGFLVDTNVALDLLTDRRPFSLVAAALFDAAAKGKLRLYISAISYSNIYYITRRMSSHAATIKKLKELSALTTITDVTSDIIESALNSDFGDLEDAIQNHCALSIADINAIVTRDIRGFKKSALPVLSPAEALSLMDS